MNISTLLKYLFGSREAIMKVASSRWSLWVGLLFVLMGGFARAWDAKDLITEPWHVLRPLVASLVLGTVLFLIVHVPALGRRKHGKGSPPKFFKAWRTFISLYWMTAPMALLYAVPYEFWMSPVEAVTINLWTLALVSVWRVSLMTRVISVVWGVKALQAFFLVMLFSLGAAITALMLVPLPVIDVMAGIQHEGREGVIANVAAQTSCMSVLLAPVVLIGAAVCAFKLNPKWYGFMQDEDGATKPEKKPVGLLRLAAVFVLMFVPMLLFTQPQQMNRNRAEKLLASGRVSEALAEMSGKARDDYPPHWNPPPNLAYRKNELKISHIGTAMAEQWPADWVAEIYIEKLELGLRTEFFGSYFAIRRGTGAWAQIAWDWGLPRFLEATAEQRITAQIIIDHYPDMDAADRAALQLLADDNINESTVAQFKIDHELYYDEEALTELQQIVRAAQSREGALQDEGLGLPETLEPEDELAPTDETSS